MPAAGVVPEKLRRTPSLSALDELVMGRDGDAQQQCFVFMLKARMRGRVRCVARAGGCCVARTSSSSAALLCQHMPATRSHTTPHHTTPHHTTPHHTTPHHTTPHHTPTHHNTPHHTPTHHNTPQHTTTHHNTPQHTTAHHNTPQHTTAHHNTPRPPIAQVGGNFPLYGCCWCVREMLHRPPYLARGGFSSCRAPFRQCMIAAPRAYCLLTHYPFFDLHFRVRLPSGGAERGRVACGSAWR
jgi:hypothetical protein